VSTLIITSLNALSFGLLLFLLSAGLTLIFSMMGVLNFAHAGFYMLGAYAAYTLGLHAGFFPALVLAPLAVGALGMLVERFGLRKVHAYGHVAELLFTFGLAFIIEELVQLVWGKAPVGYPVPQALSGAAFTVMGSPFPLYRLFVMAVSVGVLLLLYLTITRTRTGLIIQAALTHPRMVEALGHNVPRVFMTVFGVGVALAALAGAVGAPMSVTEPAMAHAIGPIVFVVIVLGGIGSLKGAFIASLLLGFAQNFAILYDLSPYQLALDAFGPGAAGMLDFELFRITIAQFAPLLPFVVMVLVLLVRPQGLCGRPGSGA